MSALRSELSRDLAKRGALACLFGALTLWTLAFGFRNTVRSQSPYTYGDWLINYADGFVRRGLGGEGALGIARLTGVELPYVVMGIVTILTIFVLGGLFLISARHVNLLDLAIILSPAALLFFVLDPSEAGRKDLIPLTVVIASALFLTVRRWDATSPTVELALTAVLATLGMFIHETTIFYIAPLLVLHLFRFEAAGSGVKGPVLVGLLSAALAALFVVIAFTPQVDFEAVRLMCGRLGAAAPVGCETPDSAIGWLQESASYGVSTVTDRIADRTYVSVYGLPLAITYLYMGIFVSRFRLADRVGETLLGGAVRPLLSPPLLVAGFFAATLPLYVLAIDWGRWLLVWFVSAYVFLKTAEHLGYIERRRGPVVGHLTEGHVGAALLIGGAFWSVSDCCGGVPSLFDKIAELLS